MVDGATSTTMPPHIGSAQNSAVMMTGFSGDTPVEVSQLPFAHAMEVLFNCLSLTLLRRYLKKYVPGAVEVLFEENMCLTLVRSSWKKICP